MIGWNEKITITKKSIMFTHFLVNDCLVCSFLSWLTHKKQRFFRLSKRWSWNLRPSDILRPFTEWLMSSASRPRGHIIFKGQVSNEDCAKNIQWRCAISQKNNDPRIKVERQEMKKHNAAMKVLRHTRLCWGNWKTEKGLTIRNSGRCWVDRHSQSFWS